MLPVKSLNFVYLTLYSLTQVPIEAEFIGDLEFHGLWPQEAVEILHDRFLENSQNGYFKGKLSVMY